MENKESNLKSFKYENPKNKQGKFAWIEIDHLIIPAEDDENCRLKKEDMFQRIEYSGNKSKAENWDWVLCGALKVCLYKNHYLVIDGGNRLRAARLNGKINKLPCMIYEVSIADAAGAFVGETICRRNINVLQRHVSGRIFKDPVVLLADKIVQDAGYSITLAGGEYTFDAIKALHTIIKIDSDVAHRAFSVCSDIAGGERIYKDLLYGVFELEYRAKTLKHPEPFTNHNIDKLKKEGLVNIISKINNKRASNGKCSGSNSRAIAGHAIQDLINKGCSTGRLKIFKP